MTTERPKGCERSEHEQDVQIVREALSRGATWEGLCGLNALDRILARLKKAEGRVAYLKDALDRIASWGEGETVTVHFDEPESASIARLALRSLPTPPKPGKTEVEG